MNRNQEDEQRTEHLIDVFLSKQIFDDLKFLSPWHTLVQFAILFSLISFVAFVYTGYGNNAFSSVAFPLKRIDYGIVIDAGSHGSRLNLYSWPARIHDPDHPLSGPVTVPSPLFAIDSSPGISEMAEEGNNPDDAGVQRIKPLLLQLQSKLRTMNIPEHKWGSLPIFLKATAGMRDLDILTRARIMNSIRRYLSDSTENPFAFRWNWARVIAGEEEGVDGWLTTNNAFQTIFAPSDHT